MTPNFGDDILYKLAVTRGMLTSVSKTITNIIADEDFFLLSLFQNASAVTSILRYFIHV